MLLSGRHEYRALVAGYSSRKIFANGTQRQRSQEFSGASECLVVESLY